MEKENNLKGDDKIRQDHGKRDCPEYEKCLKEYGERLAWCCSCCDFNTKLKRDSNKFKIEFFFKPGFSFQEFEESITKISQGICSILSDLCNTTGTNNVFRVISQNSYFCVKVTATEAGCVLKRDLST